MTDLKLGSEWEEKSTFRKLKEKGMVTFSVLSLDIKKTVTFFEDKKPIRETDPSFESRMNEWNEIRQLRYNAKQNGQEEEVKRLDELAFKRGASVKYHLEILNRDTQEKETLEMSSGAANQLNSLFQKGYTKDTHDFIYENTGETGVGRYKVLPAPIKKPLTEKEQKVIEASQVINPSDIPF